MNVKYKTPRSKRSTATKFAVAVVLLCMTTTAPGRADDDDTADFFHFKNSDFFDIDVKKAQEKAEKKEERKEDMRDLRKARDDVWQNRPQNPKDTYTETFMDTDFSMQSFQDLDLSNGLKAAADADVTSHKRDFGSRADDDAKRSDEDFDDPHRDDYKKRMRDEDRKKFMELTKPVDGMLHDAVPTPMDRRQNGGFELDPGNGYVVPYKLNGWIEIQRGTPWEDSP